MGRLVALALLAAGILAPSQAAQQSFEVVSKLRGFDKAAFAQYEGNPYTIVSYRRLDTTATEADASNKAAAVGAKVRTAIKQLRGGTDKFYADVILALRIKMCQENVGKNSVRFVSCGATDAYLDDDGNPVKLTVSALTDDETVKAYNQGQCEVAPNCYWTEIVDGDTSRAKVYADPDSVMDADGSTAKLKEWATGVVGFAIPGIILAILSLLTMVFFLICRCCCNRCGGRFPREEGYTCMQKFLPLLFFLLFAIGVIGVSAAAFLYRGTMLTAVDDIFNATSGTLENGSEWILNIQTPLKNIASTVSGSAATIKLKLDGTDFIDHGLSDIMKELYGIQQDCTDAITIPSGCVVDTRQTAEKSVDTNGNPCVPCITCKAIGDSAGAAADQMNKAAGPGVKGLSTTKAQLNTKLVSISDTVQSAVESQVNTAEDLRATVVDTQKQVDDYDKQFESYRDNLGYAIMALFALALVVIIIGFIGILLGLTPLKILANLMNIAYFLGFIVLFLTFIISAIVLAIGVVLGDACEITAVFAANWTVPLGESAKAVDACFQNESLLDVFNLSSKLDFARGGIEFPANNMDTMFEFSELDDFTAAVRKTDKAVFAFDNARYASLLSTFNGFATQTHTSCRPNNVYTEANLLQPWVDNAGPPFHTLSSQTATEFIETFYATNWDAPCAVDGNSFTCASATGSACKFSVAMREQFQLLFNMATAKKGINDFITNLHTSADEVDASTNDFETKTKKLNTDIDVIKTDLNTHLIGYVEDFEESMYCTFIATGFWKIYGALCGDLMPAITMIALMLFLCGIFLIPVNVCLIIGVKRLKAHGNGHIMDTEMKFK
ncbi:hypothetical protein V7S43_014264 [Phytophthora oleae]|uniref:Uncharacterized protein n=1 Tax=Phytophthora oleae TaxID=2107226 RepID=A0ABD3F4D8_9STRA